MTHRFGTAINCIDGRVQAPVARWLQERYHLDFVDLITEPGADKALATGTPEALASIRAKVEISVGRHGSSVVAVAGHDDCASNPVSAAEHHQHLRAAVRALRLMNIPTTIVGLWVDEQWQVCEVQG